MYNFVDCKISDSDLYWVSQYDMDISKMYI